MVGYDFNEDRVRELRAGQDRTLEVTAQDLAAAVVAFTSDAAELAACRLIIVAVPTPIDAHRNPDLGPLKGAAHTVGRRLQAGSCVVFESTVFPGATEDVCVPVLEAESGLRLGPDFAVGYSPERINPGDRQHTPGDHRQGGGRFGCGPRAGCWRGFYATVVKAGIHEASSIKVAEAAKVIENTQRDLNIALMNELSMIFDRLGIDTQEVLAAAGTKWNFLPFSPGLVGGHCIGVDPYYLTFKAESLGYHPEMILAGRRINDNMGKYVTDRAVKLLIRTGRAVRGSRVAVLGLTFKENVPDLRNTRVVDIVTELEQYGVEVLVHDPMADADEARQYYNIALKPLEALEGVDAVILAVRHRAYERMGLAGVAALCRQGQPVVLDLKAAFEPAEAAAAGIVFWRL